MRNLYNSQYIHSYINICFIMIAFGKYRGKNIATVFNSDISYCKWLHSNDEILKRNPDIKQYLDEHMKDVCLDYTMPWGKHSSKTIQWIFENDIKYFNWLNKSDYVNQNCKKLKSELLRVTNEN